MVVAIDPAPACRGRNPACRVGELTAPGWARVHLHRSYGPVSLRNSKRPPTRRRRASLFVGRAAIFIAVPVFLVLRPERRPPPVETKWNELLPALDAGRESEVTVVGGALALTSARAPTGSGRSNCLGDSSLARAPLAGVAQNRRTG